LGTEELELEKARLERRKKRKEAKEKREQTLNVEEPEVPTNGVATPDKSKPTTPIAAVEVKLSKKEEKKQAAANQTSEALQRSANETANMQLGGFSSKYSWMTNSATKAGPSIATGAGLREKLSSSRKPTAVQSKPDPKTENVGLESKHSYKQLGLLTEGPGILLRDFINVLDREGKEKKALMKGYSRLEQEKST
jgi:Transcription initiation factor TFIID component TAF4 family